MSLLRSWIAVALLAGSWMFGLGYFYPADYESWAVLAMAASILLYGTAIPLPSLRAMWIAAALLIPAAVWSPWPYAVTPVFLLLGLLLQILPIPLRWPKPLGQGIIAAGGILLIQALALAAYTAQTARSHELAWPLPQLIAGIARMFSIDAAFDGVNIIFRTMRQTHRLAPTLEFFFDPVTLCFLVGGMFFLGLKIVGELPPGKRWTLWIRCLRIYSLIVFIWLPVRAGLLMAIYVHRVLDFDPERSLYVMNHIFAPWPLLLYTIVPMLLAWRFVPKNTPLSLGEGTGMRTAETLPTQTTFVRDESFSGRFFAALLLSAASVAVFTLAVEWSPVGKRKTGRVTVVERHATWEPTHKPYDTAWYGEDAGYNYAAIYDYLGQYYDMSRIMEDGKIDDATLEKCDVLVIKTPTERYAKNEVEAVLKFAERGGGVLFIGDHTNLDGMATTMNDMARPMGFIFRDDLLFSNQRTKIRQLADMDRNSALQEDPTSPDERTCYHQHFEPPWPSHPALQYMTPMDFAVSCSVDPGQSSGRAVMANSGLWNMPPEYHTENYHPIPQHCAAMRYGAFVQLWATYFGNGRAMAFTDSTIFSNFCTFQPGKAELILGMVEWLNRGNPPLHPRLWLNLLGTCLLIAAAWIAFRGGFGEGTFLCFVAAGMAGWIGACELTAVLHRANMPLPQVQKANKLLRVVVDRTASNVPLSMGAYTKGENGSGYGLLEQWISRLRVDGQGCYTIRQKEEASFSGDAVVVICPTKRVSEEFLKKLTNYVENGGKILVFDSPDSKYSTANELLSPFKIRIEHENPLTGSLIIQNRWPSIPVVQASKVTGGESIAQIDGKTVAAIMHSGKGMVMAVGFSSLFNDRNMGGTWTYSNPESSIRQRFNVFFAIVRSLLRNKAIEPTKEAFGDAANDDSSSDLPDSKPDKSSPPINLPELPIQEMGPKE